MERGEHMTETLSEAVLCWGLFAVFCLAFAVALEELLPYTGPSATSTGGIDAARKKAMAALKASEVE